MSFDKTTNITIGFLLHGSERIWIDPFITQLKQASGLAVNPMLLPILAHKAWSDIFTGDIDTANLIIYREIGKKTELIEYFFGSGVTDSRAASHIEEREQQVKHNKIHQKIVTQHSYLYNGISDYVKDDEEAVLAKLKEFEESKEKRDLQIFMEKQIQNTRCDLQVRDMLLRRLQMQL